jgi:hypothetical protein
MGASMAAESAGRRIDLTPPLRDGIIIAACVIAQASYLLAARLGFGQFGFPLDDAWIFQTYARNLAESGGWAFVPGAPSTGSTSMLWTPLIVPAYLAHLDPVWWTFLLGLLTLIGAALGAARFFEDDSNLVSLVIGLAVAFDWHLVWAASAGMETGLFAALAIWFWVWLRRRAGGEGFFRWQNGLLLGVWGGVLMLARPEGILLLALGGLAGLLRPGEMATRLRWGVMAGVGFLLILIPFVGLNVSISGSPWPNTFAAKQTEYAAIRTLPYVRRFFAQVGVSFIGAQILLIPGLAYEVWTAARRKPVDWLALAPLGWVVLHWALYAARLPVTYQHGRYAIPTIPIVVIFGVRGMLRLARLDDPRRLVRLLSLTWVAAALLLSPLFMVVLGAPAYGRDVAFIDSEMVAAARWLDAHTPPDAVIAAHDIGALGYFAPRQIVDLAGLISPSVVPFMTDPDRLLDFVLENEADYLVVFPMWSEAYREMVSDPRLCRVWATDQVEGYAGNPSGTGPMTVYAVDPAGGCGVGE